MREKSEMRAEGRRSYLATVPPQEILPVVNGRFESSVKGIYVVGDATGMPLVKVAANQGAEVIRWMEAGGVLGRRPGDDDHLDLVIIGGGPAGLAAAIEARERGLRYVVLERNKVASTVRGFPPGKMVYAEPRGLANTSALPVGVDLEKDEFLAMVASAVEGRQLRVKEDTEVTRVRKQRDGRFAVETSTGRSFPTRLVLVAVGRQGRPRLLTCPGADQVHKVTYRLGAAADYQGQDVLVVGGGNSAIEAALMLSPHSRVTLSYRGDDFFRAKHENRRLLEQAEREGRLTILRRSELKEVRADAVVLDIDGETRTVPNNRVVALIGSLPPVDFLLDMGLELDGVWTRGRIARALAGVIFGILVYFFAKHFVLLPEAAGRGKLLVPGLGGLIGSPLPGMTTAAIRSLLPIAWLILLGLKLINARPAAGGRPLLPLRGAIAALVLGAALYAFSFVAPSVFTLDPAEAGPGPYYLPGFAWLYRVVPTYFSNAYGLYYLLYFTAIVAFGLYWAWRSGRWLIWRRNLAIIATQWTLWWGIPTFLVVVLGRNPWTPLLTRTLNAWPLNVGAFRVDPSVSLGDPAWWSTVAAVGVVWAAVLTFIVIPLVTIRWGKIYCSYICSCGALAETVGNAYRHRGPKGAWPRKLERAGFVFIVLAAVATIADLLGFDGPFGLYSRWVGTFLAGAVAIGLYPFLGQRIWCRMWCPLAFWMNFWGRWSKFKISAEPGKCIDCNVCNQYCQMGIDIKSRALQGKPVTLVDTPCVGCAECVVRCPMEVLHLGEVPGTSSAAPTVLVPREALTVKDVG
ncbi:MAG: NAD(P)-binding domain-containing protein [Planctomycetota bacterium]|nr:NAD(P)-binding domain-containing protein [Planctomycetota bacterium]